MVVTVATPDLERLGRRYAGLQLRFAALQGRAKELQTRKTQLVRAISLAKARIELNPSAIEAFNYLQEQAHRMAVGDFEDLLSAFVADVVPDAGKVHLELGTERNAPSLEIMLNNGGDLEDILKGNGGGVTNVIVTGLGYAALSRTENRQFMLLDEPDCWLKAVYVPNFTKVIAEVANPRINDEGDLVPGCQTLMISHNDVGMMDDGAHIQNLHIERDLPAYAARHGVPVQYKGEVADCAYVVWVPGKEGRKGHVEVRYRADGLGDDEQNALTKGFPFIESVSGARAWTDDMPGVRWVEVENLQRHVKTRLELSPGLNVLTGDINGGKSTLYFTALRAMAYGESEDTMIRHGADKAVVRLGLENNVVLEMERNRKGSPKVMYRRYEFGVLANEGSPESRGENGVPDFITKALKISRVDDLDIQLRSQKSPVFLLNEKATVRAQLLSVGRESGLLQALIERHRLQHRRDKEQVKRDEIELNQINRTLTVLGPLAALAGLTELINSQQEFALAAAADMHATRALVARLAPLESRVQLLAALGGELPAAPAAPALVSTKPLADVIARLERTRLVAQLPDMPEPPSVPVLVDTSRLPVLMAAFEKGQQATVLAGLLTDAPAAPVLSDTASLARVAHAIEKGLHAERLAGLLPAAPVAPKLADTSDLRRGGVNLAKRKEEVAVLEKDAAAATADATAADEALHALKHKLGVCPTCNQTFPEVSNV